MYIRKLKHPNGKVYVQVIEKRGGKYKVLRSFGSAFEAAALVGLVSKAEKWMDSQKKVIRLDFLNTRHYFEQALDGISSLRLVGIGLVLGKIFDEIGFSAIKDPLFRSLVLYRLTFPASKLKTTEYLLRYEQKTIDENAVYRYMDKLYNKQKEKVQAISFSHTQKILGDRIRIVFYDVTTLYFEVEEEDELRKTGFSKEGRHQNPQIVLGLLVSKNGYPLAYDIFEGNRYEGGTMLPIIKAFKKSYKLSNLVVVADSGLMSKANVEGLIEEGEEFVLGARIKNEKKAIKSRILDLKLKNGDSAVIEKGGGQRLIINFSEKRARKDAYNRKKGLSRLEKQVGQGKLTKENINKRGYNKYLKLEGETKVSIDYGKYKDDEKWDGLKGYLTNSTLSDGELIENYRQLWEIERAFRVAKSQIKIRPIYHRLKRRIEAHICLSFTAYKVFKELERQLKEKGSPYSAQKAIEILMNIFEIEIEIPNSGEKIKKILLLSDEQRQIASIFGFGC